MSVRVSKKYGLNPSLLKCQICGGDIGIVLFGTSYKDEKGKTAEAPKETAIHGEICDSCKEVIEKKNGVFFIEVKDGEAAKNSKNPYRTGRIIAIQKEKAQEIFSSVKPYNYIEETLFNQIFGGILKK